ncbi:MAG TPA: methylmalonyl Co-A mutase-associated GTPase MeaB [Crocinitomix sp.]|nr:methylmalonyl Co-A mutase-associated GTPase MeaB [Crocinitomix sp.]
MTPSTNPNKERIEKLIASRKKHRKSLTVSYLVDAISNGNTQALSETITLLESTNFKDYNKAQEVIKQLIPKTGQSIRIGITGVPGVGKSTFIESFGTYLINQGKRVAVLAIDPSSEKSSGSILGDKTRMSTLSANPNAYIRPSATGGSLGGVARKTRESILLCEAAGFNVVLIETVGVGQSEIAVHSMTDFFLLLMLAGAGDELQGIKRGIMEMADTILISKADGENVKKANIARLEYKNALHLFPPNDNNWIPKVETLSSYDNHGIEKCWRIITEFEKQTKSNGFFMLNRNQQQKYWMNETLKERILNDFFKNDTFKQLISQTEKDLVNGKLTSFQAAEYIYNQFKVKQQNDI